MIYSFWIDEDGQTLVEYGLLISLLALVVIGAVTVMGGRVKNMWGANADRYPEPPK
jgi:pilus assembly protein Flp/PilA